MSASTNQIRTVGVQIGSSANGGGGGGADNFSYKRIAPTATITIPANQQMIVYGGIRIEGALVIVGELCLLPIPVGSE